MKFHERQLRARQNTGRLLILYILGVAGIVGAVHCLVAGILSEGRDFLNPQIVPFSVGGTLAVILIGVAVGKASLTGGGRAVAEACGGRPVEPGTLDLTEKRYLNVVEEMSIASGVPMPGIYVLDEESGINAFAAGHTTDDYAVAVSQGCLERLNRDELQGVVAHEFSHILNGDMLRNIRLTGWLYGIMGLTVVGRVLFEAAARGEHRPRRRDDGGKGVNIILVFGLGLLVIGWIGQLFAQAIQAAISRQREHLADASAVQFTRNPSGIAGALQKIAGYSSGSRIQSPKASAFSHMFFASAIDSLFATHPPLDERIRLLDPAFNPEIATLAGEAGSSVPEGASGFSGGIESRAVTRAVVEEAEAVPTPTGMAAAGRFLAGLPEAVAVAVQEPFGASAVVHGLLLGREPRTRKIQLAHLERNVAPGLLRELLRLLPVLDTLPVLDRLPVAALATGALQRLSPDQYADFCRSTDALVAADRQVDLFEFALQRNLRRHLAPHFEPMPPRLVRHRRLTEVAPDCGVLLSCLAQVGTAERAEQEAAFASGVTHLGPEATGLELLSVEHCNLTEVEAAVERLAQSTPEIRRRVVDAGAVAVAQDGVLHEREAELLRAIADSLGCPMPPWVEWETPAQA
ncbi:MAG: M48 family metallopeptidase [Verrucomicrobia bacterium]|nr:M48 family metallopeptidase [Verrucomicrobiota bacterium]